MSSSAVVYLLTGLAGLIVVLTALRMRGGGAGRHQLGRGPVRTHTVIGLVATAGWIAFLVLGDGYAHADELGILALGGWWITAVAGIFMLARWLPSRGRHASSARADRWSSGPWLSVVAHLALATTVGVFTWAYLTSTV